MYDNNQSSFNPYAQNITILKNYFKRPTVLTLGILYIISGIIAIAVGILSGSYVNEVVDYSLALQEITGGTATGDMQFINDLLSNHLPNAVTISIAPSLISTILFVTAFFIIYTKSKNPDPNASPKAGFTILYILAIFNLISAIIASLVLLLTIAAFILIFVSLVKNANFANSDIIALSIVFVFIIAIFAFIITAILIYTISNLKYIKSVLNGLTSVALSDKGAGAYGTFSIIYGVFALISVIQNLLSIPIISAINELTSTDIPIKIQGSFSILTIIAGVASLISAVIMIFNAIIALGYKKYIHNITGEFNDLNSGQNYIPALQPNQNED